MKDELSPWGISSFFSYMAGGFFLASGLYEGLAYAMENHPVRGEPFLPGSAASNSAVASTPSSSFFQGLSGQIPAEEAYSRSTIANPLWA